VRRIRHILGVLVILCVVSAVGCDFLSTKAENGWQKQGGGVSAAGSGQNGKEAPELASMVKAGDLPPVDERLPEKPMMVQPEKTTGSGTPTLRRCCPMS
jgi:peptide/nickel transport system substrate-binding protein